MLKRKTIKKFIVLCLIFSLAIFLSSCNITSIRQVSLKKVIYVGDEIGFVAESDDKNITDDTKITWESSDDTIAHVEFDANKAIVKGVKKGNADVTVKFGDNSKTVIHITVKDKAAKVKKVSIEGDQFVVTGHVITLRAECEPDDEFVWKSSNPEIAEVENGKVKGIKKGVVTITATIKDTNIGKDVVVWVDDAADVIKNIVENKIVTVAGDFNLTDLSEKVVSLVEKVEDSVIGVENKSAGSEGILGAGISTGTAGIYKKEKAANGYKYTAFTNHHVVENADTLQVYLGKEDSYIAAELVKEDKDKDLAIITFVSEKEYAPLEIGEIGDVKTGDFVVAIGNPNGFTYYGSVTFGMVSSPNRKFGANKNYIQHDAPINPGNSGGPLFSLAGKVIGINTLKIAEPGVEGMGFAIGLEDFKDFLKD